MSSPSEHGDDGVPDSLDNVAATFRERGLEDLLVRVEHRGEPLVASRRSSAVDPMMSVTKNVSVPVGKATSVALATSLTVVRGGKSCGEPSTISW
jgi:hypothetical protein